LGIVLGLAAGLTLGGLWPNTPLHAVATDRLESFAMATGYVDEGVEAVYFLDFLTGDLNAAVIGPSQAGGFAVTGLYSTNVLQVLNIDAGKNPKFLMVTGLADLARGGRAGAQTRPARAVVYVAEVTTGQAVAFGILWNPTLHSRGVLDRGVLRPVVKFPFRGGAGMGAAAKSKDTSKE
jgi:hypothetical protein